MRCYKCGSVLSDTDFCNSCGADVTIYKKIVRMSNTYYNMGLEKARIRDLSGAADCLRRSVRMDKKNIQARNLLGLVYYEMGEFVEALSQWVISKNIKPDKNVADDYLKDAQSNPTRLEAMNMTIRKYNKALSYANEGSDDLAIIQLKKVINLNPNFVKGYQLLALLYMKKEEYARARKFLNKSLAIDTKNTLSAKYLSEIEAATETEDKKNLKKPKEEEEPRILSGNDVIIPETGYKDVNYGLMQFITMVVGILIGAAMVYFLITPAKENRAASEYKDTINNYSENISKLNITVSEMQSNIDSLTEEKENLKQQLTDASQAEDTSDSYSALIDAAVLYMNDDKKGCAVKLTEAGGTEGKGENYVSLYNALKEETFTEAFNGYRNQAYDAENGARYEEAVNAFKMCEKFQPENIEILYHLGKCILQKNGGTADDEAKEYFNKVIQLAPDSDFAGWSAQYIN